MASTTGAIDMYGKADVKLQYNDQQSRFFERAAKPLTRRQSLNSFLTLVGTASLVLWGAKGSLDADLPIMKGAQQPATPGPRDKL